MLNDQELKVNEGKGQQQLYRHFSNLQKTRIEKNREEQAREVAKGGQAATNAESIVLPQQEVGQIKVVREEGLMHRKKSYSCDQQTVSFND